MIWHVIKKDFRSQIWLAPVLALAAVGYALSSRPNGPSFGLAVMMGVALPYLAVALAMARVVQLDSPASPRGDWHTRPVNRWKILAAKGITALVCVLLPWAAVDVFWSLSWHIPLSDALLGALVHMLALGSGLLLVMTLAAATRTLIPFLLLTASLLACGPCALALLITVYDRQVYRPPTPYISEGLIGLCVWAVCGLLLAATALLYHRRRLGPARTVIVAGLVGVQGACLVAAVACATHWPSIVGGEPAEARGLAISSAGPPVAQMFNQGAVLGLLSVPLTLQKPDGVTLEIDRGIIRKEEAGGSARISTIGRDGDVLGSSLRLSVTTPEDLKAQRISATLRLRLRRTLGAWMLNDDAPVAALVGGGICRSTQAGDPVGRLSSKTLLCVSGKPLCLQGERPLPDGKAKWGAFLTGCAASRAFSGRYQMNARIYSREQDPAADVWRITQYRELGLIDRRFTTEWGVPRREILNR